MELLLWIIAIWFLVVETRNYLKRRKKEEEPPSVAQEVSEHDVDRAAELKLKMLKNTSEFVFGHKEFEPVLDNMIYWHVRLREKYKHDSKIRESIESDWLRYTLLKSEMVFNHAIWVERERNEESDAEHFDEQRKNSVQVEEIENRFAKLLERQSELEALRILEEISYMFGIDPDKENQNKFMIEVFGHRRPNNKDQLSVVKELIKQQFSGSVYGNDLDKAVVAAKIAIKEVA